METEKKPPLLSEYLAKQAKLIKPNQIIVVTGINYKTEEKKTLTSAINVKKICPLMVFDQPRIGYLEKILYEIDSPSEIGIIVISSQIKGLHTATQWQWVPRLAHWLKVNTDLKGVYEK